MSTRRETPCHHLNTSLVVGANFSQRLKLMVVYWSIHYKLQQCCLGDVRVFYNTHMPNCTLKVLLNCFVLPVHSGHKETFC